MQFILKKSDKLASATYLVTSFFSNQEPLKWKLRNLALEIVSLAILLKDRQIREQDRIIPETKNVILEILSQLSLAKDAGLISLANHSILEQEFAKYMDILTAESGMSHSGGYAILSSKFFETGESALPAGGQSIENRSQESIKDKIIRDTKKEEDNIKKYGAVSVKKNSRQVTIIALLKRKKEVMIKDISPLITDCSEKTIQRELLSMVEAGILKKIGEKRWSRYSLA